MKKHADTQYESHLTVQRVQQITRKHPRATKTLISEELIRERRAEARREMKELNQNRLDLLRQ